MSMTDARIAIGLPTHSKTKKLIKLIGTDGAWRLVCLFLYAAQNRPSGDLSGLSDEDIELAVDWAGDPGAFVAALRGARFLDGEEGAYSLHDWEEHNPWASGAPARSEKSRFAALCRQHGRHRAAELMPEYAARLQAAASSKPTGVPDSASGTPQAESGSAPYPIPSPSPSPSPSPIPSPSPTAGSISEQTTGGAPSAPPAAQSATAKGTRLPKDWVLPKAWGDWALEARKDWTPEYVRVVADKFRDHWISKPGKDAVKLDWLATWRNWVRSEPVASAAKVVTLAPPAPKPADVCCVCGAPWTHKVGSAFYCSSHDQYSQRGAA